LIVQDEDVVEEKAVLVLVEGQKWSKEIIWKEVVALAATTSNSLAVVVFLT